MFEWLKKVVGAQPKPKPRKQISANHDDLEGFLEIRDEGRMAVVDADKLSTYERAELRAGMQEVSDLDYFDGKVEHLYTLNYVQKTAPCPRCGAATEQQYANWIYGTDLATRVMLVPAGYFCTACPTVIVDEDMIRKGIVGNYKYREIWGIDDEGDFKGWATINDKKVIFTYNEDEEESGSWVALDDFGPERPNIKRKSYSDRKSSQRRRMQKESKKQQRPKKKKKR
jgi:hypothetical protein